MITRARLWRSFWLSWCVGLGAAASAHELQPGYLELTPSGASTMRVLWKLPLRSGVGADVRLVLPPAWKILGEPVRYQTTEATIERFEIESSAPFAGQKIALAGPAARLVDVLIRLVQPDGTVHVARLTPVDADYTITAPPGWLTQAGVFCRLGIEHILLGADHLLFVLGLLLIVRDGAMLLKTITAFTIAHSITLGVATLGLANAPALPLNAAIALSILFLGPEMLRVRRGETSLTVQHPWVVAFAFGLLHGFGFASGLTTLGLARGEIPLALLSFNVGVEAGQLVFVLLIAALGLAFRALEIRWTRWATLIPPYAVGGLGAYWTIQRTAILIGALR